MPRRTIAMIEKELEDKSRALRAFEEWYVLFRTNGKPDTTVETIIGVTVELWGCNRASGGIAIVTYAGAKPCHPAFIDDVFTRFCGPHRETEIRLLGEKLLRTRDDIVNAILEAT